MKLLDLCKKIVEGIEENPGANWCGWIVAPEVDEYGAQDFRDMGLPVEVIHRDAIVGRREIK